MNDELISQLLALARNSIRYYIDNKKELHIEEPPQNSILSEPRAVFVTLQREGNLRGCIGHMHAKMPLYKAVIKMAIAAAFEDPRFQNLTEIELEEINIEISVLSPMEKISDYKRIRMGIDGVWIKHGFHSGVYLPQVAIETGWDRDTFLSSLCSSKAGLSPQAYKDPKCEIYIFQVEKFSE